MSELSALWASLERIWGLLSFGSFSCSFLAFISSVSALVSSFSPPGELLFVLNEGGRTGFNEAIM